MINQPETDQSGTKQLAKLSKEFEERCYHDACNIAMTGRESMSGTIKTAASMAALQVVFDVEKKKREEDAAFVRRWLASELTALQQGLSETEDQMDLMLAEHLGEDEMNHLAQFQDDKDQYYQEADKLMQEKLARGEISQADYDLWFKAMSEREAFKASIAQVEHEIDAANGISAKTSVAKRHNAETLEATADQVENAVDRDILEGVSAEKDDAGLNNGDSATLLAKLGIPAHS